MSPEQIQGDQEIDGRSDIYSLGVILYQMLTNQTPYEADTPAKIMMMHILEPVPKVSVVDPKLMPGVDTVISLAMAKDPNSRFQTAAQMANSLTTTVQTGKFPADATQISDAPPATVISSVGAVPATQISETPLPPAATQTPAPGTQVRVGQTQVGSATMEF